MSEKLTLKQEKFCQEYIRLGEKKPLAAYRLIYSCSNLKDDTIEKKSNLELKKRVVKSRIKELKSHLGGRPTLYKPEYNEQAYKLCLLGATDKEIAEFFEVCEDTINNWKKEYPEFFVSIKEGKKISDMEVVASLYQTTRDRIVVEQQAFKCKEISYDENGKRVEKEELKVIDVERVIAADFRSQQFWLKNRKSDTWRDKQEIDHTTNGKDLPTPIDTSKLSTEALLEIKNAYKKSDE